jgi:hypothetical protein
MISIIVCSRNSIILADFKTNIKETIGVDFEIIHIDNSKNLFSICSAYNRGVLRAKFPYLCFVHEDVYFRSNNWGREIIEHLQIANVGIVGLAGRDLLTRVPATWSSRMNAINLIQSDKTKNKGSKIKYSPIGYDKPRRSVIMLDGVFMCMKRELLNEIEFDERISGFHGYDFDISIQSVLSGKDNYVIYNILIEHFSRGTPNANYYRNLIKVFKKWGEYLPLIGKDAPEMLWNEVFIIEQKGILKLTKKLIRRGFSTKEILVEKEHFSALIGVENKFRSQSVNYLKLYILQIINFPGYLFSKNK